MLALHANQTVSVDRLMGGLWGEGPAGERPQDGPALRLAAATPARRRRRADPHARARLRAVPARRRGRTCCVRAARGATGARATRSRCGAARRSADLRTSRSPPPESAGSRSCGCGRTSSRSTPTWRRGAHTPGAGRARALVAEHPLRERLHAQRMLALYRSGRQAEALEAYGAARRRWSRSSGSSRAPSCASCTSDPRAGSGARRRRPWRRSGARRTTPAAAPAPPARGAAAPVAAGARGAAGVLAFAVAALRARSPAGIDENAVGLIDPGDGASRAVPVGRGPGRVAAGAGSVWVANPLDGTVVADRPGARQVATIAVGGRPRGSRSGRIGLGRRRPRPPRRPDRPRQQRVVQRSTRERASRRRRRGRRAMGRVRRRRRGSRGSTSHAQGERSIPSGRARRRSRRAPARVWVASEETGEVVRIDPRRGGRRRLSPSGRDRARSRSATARCGSPTARTGRCRGSTPTPNTVTGTVPVGRDPSAIAVGDGRGVGGRRRRAGRSCASTRTERRRRPDRGRQQPDGARARRGLDWAAAVASAGEPPRRHPRVGLPMAAIRPIDWLNGTAIGYRRGLVASLALRRPRRLPPGRGARRTARWSATRQERPAPARGGRSLRLHAPARAALLGRRPRPAGGLPRLAGAAARPAGASQPSYYDGDRRRAAVLRRELRPLRGIEADAAPRTRHDPPHACPTRSSCTSSAPSARSARRHAPGPERGRPPPGTGPYPSRRWDRERGGTPGAQPALRARSAEQTGRGFPDRIEVTFMPRLPAAAQIARGQSAASPTSGPRRAVRQLRVVRGRLKALNEPAPPRARARPAEAQTTEWMFLNVARAAVRRRSTSAARTELRGRPRADRQGSRAGPRWACPICQVVPVGLPGARAAVSLHRRPAPGRGWIAPDSELRAPPHGRLRAARRAGGRPPVPPFRRATGATSPRSSTASASVPPSRVLDDDRYWETIYDPGRPDADGLRRLGGRLRRPLDLRRAELRLRSRAAIR